MYDPTVGRFIEEDPTEFAGGDTNFYRYCDNSPTNGTDPSGLVEYPSYASDGAPSIASLLAAEPIENIISSAQVHSPPAAPVGILHAAGTGASGGGSGDGVPVFLALATHCTGSAQATQELATLENAFNATPNHV